MKEDKRKEELEKIECFRNDPLFKRDMLVKSTLFCAISWISILGSWALNYERSYDTMYRDVNNYVEALKKSKMERLKDSLVKRTCEHQDSLWNYSIDKKMD